MAGIELLGRVVLGIVAVWEVWPGVVWIEVEQPLSLDTDEIE